MSTPAYAYSLASRIFSSLSDPRPWILSRTLRSDNPADLNGELKGTASFLLNYENITDAGISGLLYTEEGEMPGAAGNNTAGLRWTRKYIWRLSPSPLLTKEKEAASAPREQPAKGDSYLSIWFVKLQKPASDVKHGECAPGAEDRNEPDYIFHELDIQFDGDEVLSTKQPGSMVPYPISPPPAEESNTRVVIARGQHLCINDDYQTVYAFRMGNGPSGRVLSWSSRHVVRGPKKNQDIVNLYSR
ncbi:hypothetical protein EMPG_16548 [Blastomyces silverae]|uniref:DUF6314 domain-containing protein n=1 Tax=Blastomyces silverae TaxID=2060906 RepID=A0A0H1B962_9EURO|nr:hypothetical protein EMPG_16548 [Blastomyces silverae]